MRLCRDSSFGDVVLFIPTLDNPVSAILEQPKDPNGNIWAVIGPHSLRFTSIGCKEFTFSPVGQLHLKPVTSP
jgi:hypothetical protein